VLASCAGMIYVCSDPFHLTINWSTFSGSMGQRIFSASKPRSNPYTSSLSLDIPETLPHGVPTEEVSQTRVVLAAPMDMVAVLASSLVLKAARMSGQSPRAVYILNHCFIVFKKLPLQLLYYYLKGPEKSVQHRKHPLTSVGILITPKHIENRINFWGVFHQQLWK
jgi:hypothetical protein